MTSPTDRPVSAADSETLDAGVFGDTSGRRDEHIPRGASLGRYVVLDVAGTGAMGVVYRAYDPELQREVALKLLRPTHASRSERAVARLRREAQAMARVSHPNVLPVYDAGTWGDQLWIAMEFLPTETLAEWLDASRRSWRDIVAMFSQAGRGLAAAHAVGLVHRDFKPQNVLVGRDGRAVVMDFGLARAAMGEADGGSLDGASGRATDDGASGEARGVVPLVDLDLTMAGSAVGTPRYMAPEQHHGLPLDGRADQFAFCVALYESLHRVRAFEADNMAELAVRKQEHRLDPLGGTSGVPAWLHRVLLRGLAPDPSQRFATMDALLVALADDPSARRRRIATWVGGVVVLAFGVAGVVTMLVQPRPCRDADRKLAAVWDEARRAEIERAMLATDVPYAAVAQARVQEAVDDYAQQWIAAHDGACAATKIYGEQSEELLDARISCLDAARAELAAMLDVLAVADARAVERAVRSASSLRSIDDCGANQELLTMDRAPADSASVELRTEIEASVARGRALDNAGRIPEALAELEPAAALARRLGYGPLTAEALEGLATALHESGEAERARDLTIEALGVALASNARRIAIVNLSSLAYIDGYARSNWRAGHEWAGLATALNDTLNDPVHAIRILNVESILYVLAGEFEVGERLADDAVTRQRELDPDHPRMARLLGNLGAMLASHGRYTKARDYLVEALTRYDALFGPDHPDTLGLQTNLGVVELSLGQFDAAIARLESNLGNQTRVFGPDNPEIGNTLNNLAAAYRQDGQYSRAAAMHRRVVALRERSSGPDSLPVAQSENNLATVLVLEGALVEAREHFERSQRLRTRLLPADHHDIAVSRTTEAELLRAEGDRVAALAAVDAAIGPLQTRLGPVHTATLDSRVLRATLLAELDRPGEAIAELESLLVLAQGGDVPDSAFAEIEFALARLLDDPARARTLARSARARPASSGTAKQRAQEIDVWLDARR